MVKTERVTVTLPGDVLEEIQEHERNRSRFVLEAVRRELSRRRRAKLRASLASPHDQVEDLVCEDLRSWVDAAGEDEVDELVDPGGGVLVRWEEGPGWSCEED